MRLKSLIVCSTSAFVVGLAATPAAAQVDPATPPDPGAQAQTIPADPEAGAAQTDDAVQTATGADQGADDEAIVVTGLRRSLQSSQNIKRNSEQIVDVVVAEDIGKLPDRTVSEALARVPGVTVERQVGEAGDVFIRGLRDPSTTYNGREIFTAEVRHVAPQDFPAGGVAALEVFKSQTAELIEGNLAGLINVRSRRPFDFSGFELAGAANATYADLAKDWAWNGNLLVSNRWDAGDGEFGALLNVSYTELEYFDTTRFVSGDFFGINPDPANPGTYRDNFGNNIPGVTVRTPVGVGLFGGAGNRWRPSANGSLQWRPNNELEFYVDGLYQGFRRQVSDRLLFVPLFGGGATYSNVTLGQDGAEFDYPDSISAVGQVRPEGFQAATSERTNTYQFAVGAVYDTERVRIAADLARTDSQFDLSIYSVDYAFTSTPPLSVVFDANGGDGGADFDLGGFDTANLANYRYRGFFDRHLTAKGDDYQARLDTQIKDLASFIPRIDLGVRVSDHDAAFSNGERYSPQEGLGLPYGNLPLDFDTFKWNFRDDVLGVNRLTLPTYDSIRSSITELRTLAGFPEGRPPANPLQSYEAKEKSYTGYAQVHFATEGDVSVSGVLGLRAVRTEFSLDGTIENRPAPIAPFTVENEYTDYLPNASVRLRFTPQFQVRAAYTQTRQRPDFADLNPGLSIDPPGGGQVRTGRGGNPNLQPVLSDNYDVSLEYYFSRTGFAALAFFRRDIRNYIVDIVNRQDVEGIGPVDVFGPANSDEGRLQGIEAQFRTFFDFGGLPSWLGGFGTELNLTYIDNELEDLGRFPDVSKWTYNLVGFYERGPITARVAYNRRSRYAERFIQSGSDTFSPEFVRAVSRLDASVSYSLTDNVTLAADVSNILGKPFRNFREIEEGVVYPRDVRYEERVYSAGVRFRF
jgi:iron complex outermembrane receptor protein